jgi:hypothetical protein
MLNINQHSTQLVQQLGSYVPSYRHTLLTPRPIEDVIEAPPIYRVALAQTYGLSSREVRERVYRIGIGTKLNERDSDIYEEFGLEEFNDPQLMDQGIVFRTGILAFYQDIHYAHRGSVQVLAASYHFQTPRQTTLALNDRPLYARFEFDPLEMPDTPRDFIQKPIFHYHFSNYETFHQGCHFPAGHFNADNFYTIQDTSAQRHFVPPPVPDLGRFLDLLSNAGLLPQRVPAT